MNGDTIQNRDNTPKELTQSRGSMTARVLQQFIYYYIHPNLLYLFCFALCLTLKYELLLESPIYSSLCSQCLAFSRCSVSINSTGPLRKDQESLVWLFLPLRSTVSSESMMNQKKRIWVGVEREEGWRMPFNTSMELKKIDCSSLI